MMSARKQICVVIIVLVLCALLIRYTLKHTEKSAYPQLQKYISREIGKLQCAGSKAANLRTLKPCEQGPRKGSKLYFQKGEPIWKDMNLTELFYKFKPFASKRNINGMRYPHQFALYTIMTILKPTVIIESGVLRGHTTAFMRRINPEAFIISLDPHCPKVTVKNQELYCGTSFKDFSSLGERWTKIKDKEKALVIIDDHQDMTLRTKEAKQFGFKQILMEDNYVRFHGDALSLKQVFGEKPEGDQILLGEKNKNIYLTSEKFYEKRGELSEMIEIYAEFPPLNRCKTIERKISKMRSKHLDLFPNNNDTLIRREIENSIGAGLGLPVPSEEDYILYNWFLHIKLY